VRTFVITVFLGALFVLLPLAVPCVVGDAVGKLGVHSTRHADMADGHGIQREFDPKQAH
jgi:hypothetical protein